LRTGDERDQRGDTVHVGTMVERRIGLLPDVAEAGLRSIPIRRCWKLFTPGSKLNQGIEWIICL
jgi:hypothetical protein